ncbi:hypothetical protein NVV94_18160 [Pseudomonas sp. LS1212]|uniref:hypothetical protein n=1 Tax=Pseudomonas sp. LS1212 TaxID=2972478 RepID=UPI00215CF459|nr:hypothetical protein [Pseudomonas sp. LS1212]UVJ42538.1 hypothetical protein NVV94_18160 [Pseudomonas sp. LS1212]
MPAAAGRDVLAERRRQIRDKGWTADHDDGHADGKLAAAAASYALRAAGARHGDVSDFWPWRCSQLKQSDPRRMLVKAGALILAEIERLDRSKEQH